MSKRARDMTLRHFNKGVGLINKGMHKDALELLEKAETYAKEADSPLIMVNVLKTYADLLSVRGNNDLALERYLIVADMIENDPEYLPAEQRAGMYSSMAAVLESTGNINDAIYRYESAVNIYRQIIEKEPAQLEDQLNTISALNNMGALIAENKENEKAFGIFEEALVLNERVAKEQEKEDISHHGKKVTILENMLNIPTNDLIITSQRYDQLIRMYLEEKENANTGNYEHIKVCTALHNIAHLLENENMIDNAFLKLEEALKAGYIVFQNEPENPDNRKLLIDILKDMNRYLENEEDTDVLMEKYELILELSRALMAFMPSNTAYRLNVALSLDIIANLLREQGRIEDALKRMKESFDIALCVIKDEVDDEIVDGNNIQVLTSIIEDLIVLLRFVEEPEQKLAIYRTISDRLGPFAQEELELALICARIYSDTGNLYSQMKIYEDALDCYKNASSIHDTIKHATGDRSNSETNLEKIADTYYKMGLYDDAFKIYMELLKSGYSCISCTERIDEILSKKEKIADSLGSVESIIKDYEKILDIRTDIQGLVPDRFEKNADRIMGLQEKIADIMIAFGRFREALNLYELLQTQGNLERYLPKTIKLLERISVAAEGKDASERLEVFEFLLSRYEYIIEHKRDDPCILYNRASVIENVAYLMAENGNNERAVNMYQYALDAYHHLADIGDESMFLLERIASINAMIAEIAALQSDVDETEMRYEKSMGMYRILMNAEPSIIKHRTEYAGVLVRRGSVFLDMRMHTKAKRSYEMALKVYGDIMDMDPDNRIYRSNVTVTLKNLGYVLDLIGRKEDALWMYEKARSIEDI